MHAVSLMENHLGDGWRGLMLGIGLHDLGARGHGSLQLLKMMHQAKLCQHPLSLPRLPCCRYADIRDGSLSQPGLGWAMNSSCHSVL